MHYQLSIVISATKLKFAVLVIVTFNNKMKVTENCHDKSNNSKEFNNKGFQSDLIKESTLINAKLIGTDYSFKHEVVWKNAIAFFILHVLALWGLFIVITRGVGWKTITWYYFIAYGSGEGVTIGAHRYYTHKSFKAKPFLRALLILLQTMAGQNSIFTWSRDHRLHHRYSDTDADPHNINRGFFFSHIGWLLTKKHPYVKELGKKIDMSDLQGDWMLQFQKKYYLPLYFIFSIIVPVTVPVIYLGETWRNSFLVVYALRYAHSLNTTWLVNSAAHVYGTRPYDKNLQPVESWFVSIFTLGEGWHNYHHAFPWDYKAAEIGMPFNASASIIKFCEKIGLAYDLKTAPIDMVKNRMKKTGDGTHYELGYDNATGTFTAIGPVHPLNPTFTTKNMAPDAAVKSEGLPLFYEDGIDMKATNSNMSNVLPVS